MAAIPAVLTDQQSITVIMDSVANELQGLAFILDRSLLPQIRNLVPTTTPPTPVTFDAVQSQFAAMATLLCAYTVKEEAIADIIKAAAKKSAVDFGIDPKEVCDCFCCCCHPKEECN